MIKKKTKKIIKWIVGVLLALLILIIATPFLFKDKIVKLAANTINNNINATLSYKDADLSLISNFPLLDLTLKEVSLVNKAPFLGNTLYKAEKLDFNIKIAELFKSADEAINIKNISTENATVNILVNENGVGNYDIAKPSTTTENTNNQSFDFNINGYELENVQFSYVDATTKNKVVLDSIYHKGKGNFAKDVFDLTTETKALFSLFVNHVNYLNKVKLDLDAVLSIDLRNQLYTFKENNGHLNQLPLEFQGYLKLEENKQLYNLKFKTPTSSFKNAIALFPEEMTGNLADVKTEGNFNLNGIIRGELSDEYIPMFNIEIVSKDAMFKYNSLPKAVTNIALDARVINRTGKAKDTYISADKASFKIDEDTFTLTGAIKNLVDNPTIDLEAKGKINLANIAKVYPVNFDKNLEGLLTANVTTSFDMNSVKRKKYQNINNAGIIKVSNFKFDDKSVANPFLIDNTEISFNTKTVQLKEFNAKTGSSDLSAKGNLDNFYGFLFDNQNLKGNFNLQSNNLKVSDFLAKEATQKQEETISNLKIPSFLDIKIDANANTVFYDNITLKNVSGVLLIKDENLELQNVNTNVFEGKIAITGKVSTKEEKPSFSMDLNLDKLNIANSFKSLDMLTSIAPIAKAVDGKINSTINLSGVLNDNMTPDLKTLTGDFFGQLLNTKLKTDNAKLLTSLGEKISFLDPQKLNLDDITGRLKFNNGVVSVKPIPIKYKDINLTLAGTHSFDKSVNYTLDIDVPVKYLGSTVTEALQQLNPKDASEIKSIPVKALITGSFTSPTVTTNIKDATSNLVKTLVEKQKQSILNSGKDKIKGLLGLEKKKDSTKKDSVQKPKDVIKDKAKDALKNLFGKRKKDTTKKN